ncbi:MAG: sigma-70 family RNA polymerase sigma factor [Tannerellaceae bacterium]|jgi:RNA polymerase sigma factor (sigma-70 family)|nr:sigma-70 family RNA polymerase sigma factor [Tannerellaceae bacterium]
MPCIDKQGEKRDSDKMLWNIFLSGDDNAFGLLYNEYASRLYTYGLHFTSNHELVKDCVQDLFVKLYTNRKRLQPVENVKVYFYHSMKNTLFNVFKKEASCYQIDTIEPVFCIESSAETQLIETEQLYEQKKLLTRMIEYLTPRQREVLYYRFVEELSHEEICKLMQMNYQSVRNLLHRTILKMRSITTGEP